MRIKMLPYALLVLSISGHGQALQEINYTYLYRTDNPFTFEMKPVMDQGSWTVFYELKATGTSQLEDYVVGWEKRTGMNDKRGEPVVEDSVVRIQRIQEQNSVSGYVRLPAEGAPGVLSAKIVDIEKKQAWYFPILLRQEYAVDGYLLQGTDINMDNYIMAGDFFSVVGFSNTGRVVASYYTHDFPAAAPAFSEALARVSSKIVPDSVFGVDPGQPIALSGDGLYLLQQDTTTSRGVAFRIFSDYPKYGKLENLVDPLIYICTRQEFEKLKGARGEKKAFDRVILSITGQSERAKNLMRVYFRRVEVANRLFSSFKEGWKTDRGMIYIVFGVPDEVFRFSDREVWNYDNSVFKISFSFVRSSTLFDPDNFVLVRQKKYLTTWYEVIDLWRNARF